MSLALLQTTLCLPAELLLNQLLTLDGASRQRLAKLEGRTLALHATRPEFELYISIRNHKLHLSPLFEGEADASLRGTAGALLGLLSQKGPIHNLAPLKVELQGSTSFVQSLQDLLKELDIDWDFHLGKLIGDLPVAAIRKGMDASGNFVRQTGLGTLDNIHEYLAYECDVLPSRTTAEQFYADISELTLRADRLQAKISARQKS